MSPGDTVTPVHWLETLSFLVEHTTFVPPITKVHFYLFVRYFFYPIVAFIRLRVNHSAPPRGTLRLLI